MILYYVFSNTSRCIPYIYKFYNSAKVESCRIMHYGDRFYTLLWNIRAVLIHTSPPGKEWVGMVWAGFVATSIILVATSEKNRYWRHGWPLCWKGLGRTLHVCVPHTFIRHRWCHYFHCFCMLYSAQYWYPKCQPTPYLSIHCPWAQFCEAMVCTLQVLQSFVFDNTDNDTPPGLCVTT